MSHPRSRSRLDLDGAAETERCQQFLVDQLGRPPRHHGYVVGLSGGIDSSLTAALAVRAIGTERVLGVLLPERESQTLSRELALQLARELKIETVEEDLTAWLEAMGVYRRREAIVRSVIEGFGEGWTYRLRLPGDLRSNQTLNVYRLEAIDPAGVTHDARLSLPALRGMQAATAVKQRLRMLRLYHHAEQRGYLVCGTTNRTELVQGFFVRHGDGGVDVEILAHLYKTQVYALSRHLGLPDAVIERPPSPDTYSAPVTDEEFYFRLPYSDLDRVLACNEDDVAPGDAARETGLDVALVHRIYDELRRRREATERLRELPPNLLDTP